MSRLGSSCAAEELSEMAAYTKLCQTYIITDNKALTVYIELIGLIVSSAAITGHGLHRAQSLWLSTNDNCLNTRFVMHHLNEKGAGRGAQSISELLLVSL